MGLLNGTEMITELQRRLTNLDSTTALAALNNAQKWILRQGSFTFMTTAPVTLTISAGIGSNLLVGGATLVANVDIGKAKLMLNTDGSPIQHVAWSDFWQSINYNLPASDYYDTYTVQDVTLGTNYALAFYFLPSKSGSAYFYGHRGTSGISNSTASYTDLPANFDYLVIDLAEAFERRIYDVGDSWQLLMAQSQDQIKVLLDGYRSETIQATSLQDAQTKIQETTSLGRS